MLGLVGESASGKTTAATSLLAHQRRGAKIAGGTIDDRRHRRPRPRTRRRCAHIRGGLISYVPQDSSAALNPALRIGTQLMEILEAHGFGASGAEREARLAEMMAEVLLPSDKAFLRRYPHQLSGGQQQRVAIAMAFANRPKVIVLDEPTTALDVTTQAHVLDTIRDLTRRYGVAALYVTHDLAVVANLADRIAVMYAGRLVEIGTRDELFAGGCHPYTRKLLGRRSPTSPASAPCAASRAGRRGPASAPPAAPSRRAATGRSTAATRSSRPAEEPEPDHRCAAGAGRRSAPRRPSSTSTLRDKSRSARGAEEPTVISVRDVIAFYQRKEILHGITRRLSEHRCLALVGESGSGKTTLARCIAGLHPLQDRRRHRAARQGRSRATRATAARRPAGHPVHLPEPLQLAEPAQDHPSDPRRSRCASSSTCRATRWRTAMAQVLEQVALDSSLLSRYPDQLSGGERQRIAIARGAGGRADGAHLRRGHLVARRLRAGGDHRAARQPAARDRVSRCCSSPTTSRSCAASRRRSR